MFLSIAIGILLGLLFNALVIHAYITKSHNRRRWGVFLILLPFWPSLFGFMGYLHVVWIRYVATN